MKYLLWAWFVITCTFGTLSYAFDGTPWPGLVGGFTAPLMMGIVVWLIDKSEIF